MKSFKKYIAEVAEPLSPEEKKFKDQHKVEADKHPVALDHQHTGDIKKPKAKRKADQEGDANYDLAYESLEETTLSATKKPVNVTGPDGKVRTVMRRNKAVQHDEKGQDVIKTKSEELSPKQKKIDHNKNGKIDGHDLAMLRAKKKNEESVEEAFGNWQVKTNKITKTYKARHAGEALRKAKESGHFGNIALDAKHVSKVNESVEQLDEMTFKKGPLELNDGKQVMLSSEDAKVLNDMFKKLDPRNKRTMEKSIVRNQSNFSELLKFAKEVD